MSTLQEIHLALLSDEAYIWSLNNESYRNMAMVLRAHKYPFTSDDAFAQVVYGMNQLRVDEVAQPKNVDDIKAAIEMGYRVFVGNKAYEVKKYGKNQWLIACELNGSYIGLTHTDGVTLNCRLTDLIIEKV